MTITQISQEQISQAKKVIREHFPGKANAGLRLRLRAQLTEAVGALNGQEKDWTTRVKLGRGIFFVAGDGDPFCQGFNHDVNKALGLN